jgi:hypothetical protein
MDRCDSRGHLGDAVQLRRAAMAGGALPCFPVTDGVKLVLEPGSKPTGVSPDPGAHLHTRPSCMHQRQPQE